MDFISTDKISDEHLHASKQREIQEKQKNDSKNFFNEHATMYRDLYDDPEKNPYSHGNKVIENRVKQLDIKSILDAGCGAGIPMIRYLKQGYQVKGVDFAEKQLDVCKEDLKKNNFDPKLVNLVDLENCKTISNEKFDCIISVGVFPHVIDSKNVLSNLQKILNPKGKVFIQFRNSLLSLFSLNQYSYSFYLENLLDESLPPDLRIEAEEFFKEKCAVEAYNYEFDILSKFDNPLTIENEIFKPLGLEVDKIHFFHYHILPPVFDKKYPDQFKKLSNAIENPNDWRGYFLASSFIIEATNK